MEIKGQGQREEKGCHIVSIRSLPGHVAGGHWNVTLSD